MASSVLPTTPIYFPGGGSLRSCDLCGVVLGNVEIHAATHGMQAPSDWLENFAQYQSEVEAAAHRGV